MIELCNACVSASVSSCTSRWSLANGSRVALVLIAASKFVTGAASQCPSIVFGYEGLLHPAASASLDRVRIHGRQTGGGVFPSTPGLHKTSLVLLRVELRADFLCFDPLVDFLRSARVFGIGFSLDMLVSRKVGASLVAVARSTPSTSFAFPGPPGPGLRTMRRPVCAIRDRRAIPRDLRPSARAPTILRATLRAFRPRCSPRPCLHMLGHILRPRSVRVATPVDVASA